MKTKRTRRNGEVIRSLLLDAARELFAEKGYAGAVTREIAARANVSEVLLFRHFTSKAQLFEKAVFEPMDRYIRAFQHEHLNRADSAPASLNESRDFVIGLHALLTKNRRLLMALASAETFEDDIARSLRMSPALKDYFDAASAYMERGTGVPAKEYDVSVRLSFGAALALVLFQEWLLPKAGSAYSERKLLTDLTTFCLAGLEALTAERKTAKAKRTRRAVAKRKRTKARKS